MEEISKLLKELLGLLQKLSEEDDDNDEYSKIDIERRVRAIIKDELGAWFPGEHHVVFFRGS